METYFISSLKSLLDAVAEEAELYVPSKAGDYYVFSRYDASSGDEPEFNNIRACTPAKEFLFPLREMVAVFAESFDPGRQKPFALFGLKDCDLRSIAILDKVFLEPEFLDPFYASRRENMLIISSDCIEPGQNCFCNLFGGNSFPQAGFDLNVSKVGEDFIVEVGSPKGADLIEKHKQLFSKVPPQVLARRDEARRKAEKQLEENNAKYKLATTTKEAAQACQDSDIIDVEAENCVECQGCTRVCPTCHCFYLYDDKQKDYFGKMKMWDSCIRLDYARVAGGANPHKLLNERLKHRLMHKFSYFLDRYGVEMCVGCGRCMETCAGGMDIREVLKKLSEEKVTK